MKQKENLLFWLVIFILFCAFVGLISSILLPFVAAFLVAYFLDPVVDKIEEWGTPRGLATFIITLVFFVILGTLSILIVPILTQQLLDFAKKLPTYIAIFNEQIIPLVETYLKGISPELIAKGKEVASSVSGSFLELAVTLVSNVWQSSLAVLNLLSLIFITPIVAFYILRDWDRILAHIDRYLPKKYAKDIRQQCKLMDQTLSAYIRGQTNVCLFLGVFYAVGLSMMGLEFGLLVGFSTGVLSFIPYVGILFGMLASLLIAFFQFGDLMHIALVVAIFVVGQVLEGGLITPSLIGDKVGLHPVWIIFGMLAGAALFGFTGILLAIPVTAVIGVLIRFMLTNYQKSDLFLGPPAKKTKAKKSS